MAGARFTAMLCSLSVLIGVAACGGGDGGVVTSTPTPTPSPAPTPTPTPPLTTKISAPTAATMGSNVPPVFASTGGPNFTTGPAAGTTFPLLQTMIALDNERILPDFVPFQNAAKATVTSGSLQLDVQGRFQGPPTSSGSADLDWTRYGYWSTGGFWDGDLVHRGFFVGGYITPQSGVPTSGSATYTGRAEGSVFYPVAGVASGTIPSNGEEVRLSGNAQVTADFTARTIVGALTGITVAGGAHWNEVAFTANIVAGSTAYSGNTRVTSAPAGPASLGAGATGTIEGRFFGPTAQETGGIWTLFDGVKAAIGTLAGER